MSNAINQAYNPLHTQVASYSQSKTLDLSDSSAILDLKYVSNSMNYGTCSQGNFQNDSWTPHNQEKSIPCLSSQVTSANNSTCPNSFSFVGSNVGCKGCMGTFSLLYDMNSSTEAFAYLNARYTDCPSFNTEMSNIWENYYLIKRNTLSPVLARESTAQQSVASIDQDLTTSVNPLFSDVATNL